MGPEYEDSPKGYGMGAVVGGFLGGGGKMAGPKSTADVTLPQVMEIALKQVASLQEIVAELEVKLSVVLGPDRPRNALARGPGERGVTSPMVEAGSAIISGLGQVQDHIRALVERLEV